MTDMRDKFETLTLPAPPDALVLLRDFEQQHKVWLSLHDIVGVLALPDGTSVVPREYLAHRQPRCRHGRDIATTEAACLAHCWRAAHSFGAQTKSPFTHRCWRDQRELVVPVFDDEILCMVMFLHPRRPPWPRPARLAAIAREAEALARLLIHRAEELQGVGGETDDRKRILRRLLAFHAHQPVGRDAVAKTLGVSASRASHIVTELFGKSWRQLLTEARLERAKRLLRQESLTVATVAGLCGYTDPNTFHRLFRKSVGTSPQRWRQSR
jgi:AraC-like DNA-binding protein